jgi:dienelactone hydrolase
MTVVTKKATKRRELQSTLARLLFPILPLASSSRSGLLRLLCGLVAVVFLAALLWAKNRDPFTRLEFSLKTAHAGKTKGVVVLPKPAARFPVVVYFYGAGGSALASGKILRQFAELGCAAVAIEYNQTNQAYFNEQLLALNQYLEGRPWAQSNAVAWVGFSLGAQRSLSFLLAHPDGQPQLYVSVAGGMVEELRDKPLTPSLSPSDGERVSGGRERGSSPVTRHLPHVTCKVLLIHGAGDEVFPIADCQTLAELLRTNGVAVATRIVPGQPHAFGENIHVVMRAVAEYCIQHLPLADYAATLRGCDLSAAERQRFNEAMSRAGHNRRELWKAVTSSGEPERRTVMMVIGGLEDYDLAHISAAHLREIVQVAWRARRAYPWCRDVPREIFERFTAAPRVAEEPLGRFQSEFYHRLRREVKYCHTTAEASDAVAAWERRRIKFDPDAPATEQPTPRDVLRSDRGSCYQMVALYVYLARAVGLPARAVDAFWPTLGSSHAWVEIWDTDKGRWQAFDGASSQRGYGHNWVLNVPKAATHTARGERGAWNAENENRWEAFTNSVALCYPSGQVRVRVLDAGAPATGRRVNVQVWLKGRMVHLTSGKTDEQGEVTFTLGQSARQPYRFVLDGSDENDWAWVAVQADRHYEITLHTDRRKPFDAAATPPPLGFPEWDKLPARR